MSELGWGYLIGCVRCLISQTKPFLPFDQPTKQNANHTLRLLTDPDEAVQEQAFAILRNLSESEEGIEMVFSEVGPKVLDVIAVTLGGSACACDDVVLQVIRFTSFPRLPSLFRLSTLLTTTFQSGRVHPRQPLQHPLRSFPIPHPNPPPPPHLPPHCTGRIEGRHQETARVFRLGARQT